MTLASSLVQSPFAFQAVDLKGKPVSLSQYRGKVLLMDFWATWCGPCCAELPNVVAAYNKYHGQGLEVVGVSLDEKRSALTGYVKSHKIPYRNVFDGMGWESALAAPYKVQAIPFSLLIGRNGKIVAINAFGPELRSAVKKALAAN